MDNLTVDIASMIKAQLEIVMASDLFAWAYFGKLKQQDGLLDVTNHEYQIDIIQCNHPDQCAIKGDHMVFTETQVCSVDIGESTDHSSCQAPPPVGGKGIFGGRQ
jgi:hypothetical protein